MKFTAVRERVNSEIVFQEIFREAGSHLNVNLLLANSLLIYSSLPLSSGLVECGLLYGLLDLSKLHSISLFGGGGRVLTVISVRLSRSLVWS